MKNDVRLLRSWRGLCVLVLGLVGGLVLSCSTRDAADDGRVHITFWHSMGAKHQVILEEFAKEFEQLNPDIKVTEVYQGNYEQLKQKLIASFSSRTNPTCSQMYESWTSRFMEKDLIKPVSDFFDGPNGFSQEEIDDIVKGFRDNNSWNGRMYTLAFNKSAYVLYYNKDAFEAAGLGPPKTWEEFETASIRLTRRDDKGDVICYGFGVGTLIEAFSTFFYQNDGRFFSDDLSEVLFADDKGVEALEFISRIINEHKAGYVDSGYLTIPFGAERIMMFISSSASFPYVEIAAAGKFRWGAAPLPTHRNDKVLFQGTNVGIFSWTTPQEQAAAWKYLKFITDTKHTTQWAIGTGYMPVRYSSLTTPEMVSHFARNPNYKIATDQLDKAIFDPRCPEWENIRNFLTDAVDSAFNNRKSPRQALLESYDKAMEELRGE